MPRYAYQLPDPTRRTFLAASALGIPGIATIGSAAPAPAPKEGRAKSTILFFLCGGASHLDTWDMKPDAPEEYRGPFRPIATSAPGVRLSEHLPLLSKQAHHLAVINSVDGKVNTNDHHAGYYHQLTGHEPDLTFRTQGNDRRPYPDDWPFVGAVVGAKRTALPHLPNAITLPHKPSRLPYTRPGQFAGRLGAEFDPLYLQGSREDPLAIRAPDLSLSGDVTPERLSNRYELRQAIDSARRELEIDTTHPTWGRLQDRAAGLLTSSRTANAFDLTTEPKKLRERYGESINGMSLLMARRLVEAEVPFITVFWMEDRNIASKCRSAGSWDTHGNNFNCLKDNLLPEFDRGFSALLEDLSERGLLDSTMVWVTSEMGRKPKIGDRRSGGESGAGRDHWTYCLSVLLAGGGIRGGQVYGSSDKRGEYPLDQIVTPGDIAATVYHAMGITDLEIRDREDRPHHLIPNSAPILGLL